ncbi:integrase catalytic subunit [Streptomyces viridochromogenes DSM 40736]|uniref:Integrase catalytic subunit n=1 Tax=Streptomyces viridochromogenes (strain DSM 40736 / JCM 4977 / BCRC 1201 / Tue 494) TaxID=591159 RepID=D9X337_STRVT|nr:hypothetical protein [Streptomyces viridochromogenes]EFL29553.1 integrase catalytic subunit [Streptomyces viridochromogenes DSM 40736]
MQIDTTRLDVLALFDDGTLGRPEMTIAVDVATRAILAAVLCPGGTQAVDVALLLAEMAVPHPARPAWPDALRFTHTQLPAHKRLLTLEERLKGAAARPVVVPETIIVDRGPRHTTPYCDRGRPANLRIRAQPALQRPQLPRSRLDPNL